MSDFIPHVPAWVRRRDSTQVTIDNPAGVDLTLFANPEVLIELAALDQARSFVSLEATLSQLGADFWGDEVGHLEKVVLTPDLHQGELIPVGTVARTRGFVIPQAVGNDICCGMRLLTTDVTQDEFASCADALAKRLRELFFQGQRDIPLSPNQREHLLTDGLWGLWETAADNQTTGTWRYYDRHQQEQDLARTHFHGILPTQGTFAFADYIRGSGAPDSRDSQIGSIGGGNHFVELQRVDEVLDGATAHAWGVKPGQTTVMIHSGSVGLGHMVGNHFLAAAQKIYPAGLKHPAHGFYVLPTRGPHTDLSSQYMSAMHNAANFGFANRLFLGLMVVRALSETLGREVGHKLIYDAPHNLIWPEKSNGYIHRKGACPALGPETTKLGSTAPYLNGHPVIIPGSMCSASFLLAGQGNPESLTSACHGAGRSLARNRSRHVKDETYQASVAPLRVVTPIDPKDPAIRSRRDILAKYHDRLKEEAPYAYKAIDPVIATVTQASIARPVARLWPLLTVKG